MALKKILRWSLIIGEKLQYIEENLLDFAFQNIHRDGESAHLLIPQLLQEVYYVAQLSKRDGEQDGILSIQDEVYDYIRVFHGRILEIIQKHHKYLTDENDFVDRDNQLLGLLGSKVGIYVRRNMPEPYLTRDLAYMIFNMLPFSYKCHLPHYARRDIVSSYACFEKYWNKGIDLLCEMQQNIHTLDANELKKLLSELAAKNNGFKKRYLMNSGGCFSLTMVRKNGIEEDVLCFSGQKFRGLNAAIDAIAHSGRFRNPVIIKESLKVRYYICPGRYVTFAEARETHKDSEQRMFSCCERKTFAEYDWQGVDSYTMIVKYQPCELCQWSVYMHMKRYRGTIRAGVELPPLKNKDFFDTIAEDIYREVR